MKESQIENLFIVDIGDLQPIYASKNGEFFFYGELYAVNGNMLQNTTKDEVNLKRKSILDETLSEDDFISFKSENEKHSVTIFTDVEEAPADEAPAEEEAKAEAEAPADEAPDDYHGSYGYRYASR